MNARICIVSVLCTSTFALSMLPRVAGREFSATRVSINGPSTLATDSHGHLFVIALMENKVRRIDLREGTISTVAGNGKKCCYKNGAKATEVSLDFPRSLAVDSQGNIYIAENDQIKRVDGHTGLISTVAGDGTSGRTVNGVSAISAHFWEIDGLAVDFDGNLFAADGRQSAIFKVDAANGTVYRYAGNGKSGFAGDGGLAVDAGFRVPDSLATDKRGNLIVADFENCRIGRVDRATSITNTIAFTGGAEQSCPFEDNSRPGPFPSDPVSDSAGNVYFLEGALDLVFRIDAETSTVTIVAGNGHRGFSGDNGLAVRAELGDPSGLAIDMDGNLYIAEFVNNRVHRVDAKTKIITTVAGNGLPHRIDVQL